jgi:hypothetical protein
MDTLFLKGQLGDRLKQQVKLASSLQAGLFPPFLCMCDK